MFCAEPEISNTLFGENRGCFEPPHKVNNPKTGFNCPELLPLSVNPREVCQTALKNPEKFWGLNTAKVTKHRINVLFTAAVTFYKDYEPGRPPDAQKM